ncbi:M20/M25/M40 family metallo-hydrolase [Sandaracinobacteroides saxicola]|uniref:Carboxypeptidase Q n=1 Tax=Sandaracinobacteroides saxicola TaxID=2759707 RepID=A0A7G5II19_9SPHN|nr:M20/M25/M40 family metallo-hydrolase [Sandaracinobacteroides saxicola]QMW23011.1 M20/M25/M40 family metallo-hydrolase [Sandaracinobacteroides saxicola]
MMRLLLLTALLLSSVVQAAEPADSAAKLRDAALGNGEAYRFLEAMTTEVPLRLAATESEAKAAAWLTARLKAMGFSNVRSERFPMPRFDRGVETASITAPFPQPLHITALGRSGATPPEGLEAEVVRFASLDDLRAVPDGSLTGRIAYVTHAMVRTQDGSSYGAAGAVRRSGPSIAAKKGAAAILIRSLGTDHQRNPHAGSNSWDAGQAPIPAAAMSLPDAEQLDRVFARGRPVTIRLVLTPRITTGTSQNVLAEIPGSDPVLGKEVVLIGGHYDAWDLATGAQDDASGCAIVVAAAKTILDAKLKPKRTIRVVLFGAEEPGIFGGRAYAEAHKAEVHALAAESDFGAGRVYQISSRVNEAALPVVRDMVRLVAPLGVSGTRDNDNRGGPDLVALAEAGVPTLEAQQDGLHYFDVHHTPDDTLDKVEPAALAQNSAVYAVIAWVAANSGVAFAPVKP